MVKEHFKILMKLIKWYEKAAEQGYKPAIYKLEIVSYENKESLKTKSCFII